MQVAVAHPAELNRDLHVLGAEGASFNLELGQDAAFVLGGDGEGLGGGGGRHGLLVVVVVGGWWCCGVQGGGTRHA